MSSIASSFARRLVSPSSDPRTAKTPIILVVAVNFFRGGIEEIEVNAKYGTVNGRQIADPSVASASSLYLWRPYKQDAYAKSPTPSRSGEAPSEPRGRRVWRIGLSMQLHSKALRESQLVNLPSSAGREPNFLRKSCWLQFHEPIWRKPFSPRAVREANSATITAANNGKAYRCK